MLTFNDKRSFKMKLKKLLKVIPEHEFLMIKSGEVRWLQEHVIPKKSRRKIFRL